MVFVIFENRVTSVLFSFFALFLLQNTCTVSHFLTLSLPLPIDPFLLSRPLPKFPVDFLGKKKYNVISIRNISSSEAGGAGAGGILGVRVFYLFILFFMILKEEWET